jgi:predicted alpha-1,6-mannanase (GH76 family)
MSPEELVCHLIDQATKPHYIEYLVGTRRTDPGRDKRIVRTVRDQLERILGKTSPFKEDYIQKMVWRYLGAPMLDR